MDPYHIIKIYEYTFWSYKKLCLQYKFKAGFLFYMVYWSHHTAQCFT